MDTMTYRKIILDNLNNCSPILKQIDYDIINQSHSFIMDNNNMCIGWLISNRVYPVFQSTRHIKWLNSFNKNLKSELQKRKERLIKDTLQNILPMDIIYLLFNYV